MEAASESNDKKNTIIIKASELTLSEGLVYDGDGDLNLRGDGVNLIANSESGIDSIFSVTSDANVSVSGITFDGNEGAANHGILVDIPEDAEGEINISLRDVTVVDTLDHGFHVNDQTSAAQGGESADGKDDSTGNDSEASIKLTIVNSSFRNNGGFEGSVSDSDGARVDEGGIGSVDATIINSEFSGNGADGLEIDETGTGDVTVKVIGSSFDNNGPFDLDDTDDGFDIDEAGDGYLNATVINSTFNGNYDEGLDFDEAGEGSIVMRAVNLEASGNGNAKLDGATDLGGTGIKLSEEQAGDIITNFSNIIANMNDDYGIRLEQFGGGEVNSSFTNIETSDNDNKNGIRLESYASDDGDEDEVLATLNASFSRITAFGNGKDDLRFDGGAEGDGSLVVFKGLASPDALTIEDKDFGGMLIFTPDPMA